MSTTKVSKRSAPPRRSANKLGATRVSKRNKDDGSSAELEPPLALLRAFWALEHAVQRTSMRMEATLGLTAQQRFVVRMLGRLKAVTPGELSRLLHVDPGSVTALVKRLETRRLVARKPDESDGRRHFLSLTARGHKHDVPIPMSVEQAVADAVDESSAAELAAVHRVLARITKRLHDLTDAD
jgi:DNA-binding MarR family transcriptional regulator